MECVIEIQNKDKQPVEPRFSMMTGILMWYGIFFKDTINSVTKIFLAMGHPLG